MITVKITNQELYSSLINDVDTDGLTYNESLKGFTGDLTIDLMEGGFKNISGQHGAKDYSVEFGFEINYTPSLIVKDNSNGKTLDWNGEWTGIPSDGRFFTSKLEAKNYINECNWQEWTYVDELI